MIAKLKTLYWFVSRPAFYWHGLELFSENLGLIMIPQIMYLELQNGQNKM